MICQISMIVFFFQFRLVSLKIQRCAQLELFHLLHLLLIPTCHLNWVISFSIQSICYEMQMVDKRMKLFFIMQQSVIEICSTIRQSFRFCCRFKDYFLFWNFALSRSIHRLLCFKFISRMEQCFSSSTTIVDLLESIENGSIFSHCQFIKHR